VHREAGMTHPSTVRHPPAQKTRAVVGDMDGSPRTAHGDYLPRPCAECSQEHDADGVDAGGEVGGVAVGAAFHSEKG